MTDDETRLESLAILSFPTAQIDTDEEIDVTLESNEDVRLRSFAFPSDLFGILVESVRVGRDLFFDRETTNEGRPVLTNFVNGSAFVHAIGLDRRTILRGEQLCMTLRNVSGTTQQLCGGVTAWTKRPHVAIETTFTDPVEKDEQTTATTDTLRIFPAAPGASNVLDDDLHTRACMEYAAKTKKTYCIAECADARRHRNWLRATHTTLDLAPHLAPHTTPDFAPVLDLDAQRELSRAAKRITFLENALREITNGQCDARGATLLGSCKCCLHDRTIAKAALAGIE